MNPEGLALFSRQMLPELELAMQAFVRKASQSRQLEVFEMVSYQLGWSGDGAGPAAQGKRIRPLLLLLCNAALGGDWHQATLAAVSIELLHNFSLIHDDIQDQSLTRRGRPTLWVQWGIAQAINAGDLMFSLAQLAMLEAGAGKNPGVAVEIALLLNQTCVELTCGQYLDLDFEKRRMVKMPEYLEMITEKTATLLGGSAEIGAILAGAAPYQRIAMRKFGIALGLAFQAVDDWLGIWGNAQMSGKSTESDLVTGKKTLPVIFALANDEDFTLRWNTGSVRPEEVTTLADLLVVDGAQKFVEQTADDLTRQALEALDLAEGNNSAAGKALFELTKLLLAREH